MATQKAKKRRRPVASRDMDMYAYVSRFRYEEPSAVIGTRTRDMNKAMILRGLTPPVPTMPSRTVCALNTRVARSRSTDASGTVMKLRGMWRGFTIACGRSGSTRTRTRTCRPARRNATGTGSRSGNMTARSVWGLVSQTVGSESFWIARLTGEKEEHDG